MKGTRTATRIVIDWRSGYAAVIVIDDGAVRAPTTMTPTTDCEASFREAIANQFEADNRLGAKTDCDPDDHDPDDRL